MVNIVSRSGHYHGVWCRGVHAGHETMCRHSTRHTCRLRSGAVYSSSWPLLGSPFANAVQWPSKRAVARKHHPQQVSSLFSFLVYFGLVTYAVECLWALHAPLIPFYHVFFGCSYVAWCTLVVTCLCSL